MTLFDVIKSTLGIEMKGDLNSKIEKFWNLAITPTIFVLNKGQRQYLF